MRAAKVVLAAGVLGTVPLLLRCKSAGLLPELSDRLGTFVRTNSESLLGVRSGNADDMSHGIAIADLAAALDRKACSVSKYATNHGIRFGRRTRRTPTPTLDDILALDAPTERGGGAGLVDHVTEQSPERLHADDQHDARGPRRERRNRRLGRRRPLRHEARRQERRLTRRP